jgi:membrane protease YdiL (CAAX protease family)
MPTKGEEKQPWLRPELVASWGEIVAVLAVTVGPFALYSNVLAWQTFSSQHLVFSGWSNYGRIDNAVFEGAILGVFLIYLHWRGWKPIDLRIRPGPWATVQGILLPLLFWIGSFIAIFGAAFGFFLLIRDRLLLSHFLGLPISHGLVPVNPSWIILVVTAVLNAFIEEIVYLSYAFNQFATKRSVVFAFMFTLLLRASCHTYHGPIYIWGNIATFLVITLWYVRTRNVWPIIVAHALFDIGLELHIFRDKYLFHLIGW